MVIPREFVRWSVLLGEALIALGCGDSADSPTTQPAPEAGRLITATPSGEQSATITNAQLAALDSSLEVDRDVTAQRIVYWSPDVDGELTQLSALVAYPSDADDPLPLLGYQHGTLTVRDSAPSAVTPGITSITEHPEGGLALIFAARGYVVVAADYIGLGVSETFHPYLHAQSEATAVIDALRAARELASEQDIELSDQLFLTGLSQGGHATMAAHRAIEQDDADEFTVTASAPVAGPYQLSETAVDGVLAENEAPHPYHVAYLLVSYNRIYEFTLNDGDLFANEIAETLPSMFDGEHEPDAIDLAMVPVDEPPPKRPDASIAPSLLASFAAHDDHPLRVALRENDVDDWSPVAPIHLYHCTGDEDVPFEISENTLAKLLANGADAELVEPPEAAGADHMGCFPASLTDIGEWFASLQ